MLVNREALCIYGMRDSIFTMSPSPEQAADAEGPCEIPLMFSWRSGKIGPKIHVTAQRKKQPWQITINLEFHIFRFQNLPQSWGKQNSVVLAGEPSQASGVSRDETPVNPAHLVTSSTGQLISPWRKDQLPLNHAGKTTSTLDTAKMNYSTP